MLRSMLKKLSLESPKCKLFKTEWLLHYENLPVQYTEIFSPVKIENFIRKILIFFLFLLNTYTVGTRKNRLAEAVLTSTHNLCLGAKIRKIGIPLHTPVLLYKSGV